MNLVAGELQISHCQKHSVSRKQAASLQHLPPQCKSIGHSKHEIHMNMHIIAMPMHVLCSRGSMGFISGTSHMTGSSCVSFPRSKGCGATACPVMQSNAVSANRCTGAGKQAQTHMDPICVHAEICTHSHAHTHTHKGPHTQNKHTHTHTQTHKHRHTHTHSLACTFHMLNQACTGTSIFRNNQFIVCQSRFLLTLTLSIGLRVARSWLALPSLLLGHRKSQS